MWTYGFLKLVPPQAIIPLPGAAIGPEFIGGIIFGGLVFGILFAVPWLDRTNRSTRSYEYLEPVWQAPLRTALGVAFLAYLAALFIAAYYDSLGLTVAETWLITLAIPMVVGSAVFLWQKRAAMYHAEDFDPTGETTQVPDAARPAAD